jgi:hypothetical protein
MLTILQLLSGDLNISTLTNAHFDTPLLRVPFLWHQSEPNSELFLHSCEKLFYSGPAMSKKKCLPVDLGLRKNDRVMSHIKLPLLVKFQLTRPIIESAKGERADRL